MTERLEPGLAMDCAVGRLIGHQPERYAIVTRDGGQSCCAAVDRNHGPWYFESQLREWLQEQQAAGCLRDAVISYWERWPCYSTQLQAAWQAVEWLAAHGWWVEIRSYVMDPLPEHHESAVIAHVSVGKDCDVRMCQSERPSEAICRALIATLRASHA